MWNATLNKLIDRVIIVWDADLQRLLYNFKIKAPEHKMYLSTQKRKSLTISTLEVKNRTNTWASAIHMQQIPKRRSQGAGNKRARISNILKCIITNVMRKTNYYYYKIHTEDTMEWDDTLIDTSKFLHSRKKARQLHRKV